MAFTPRVNIPSVYEKALAAVSVTKGDALIVDSDGYISNSGVATSLDIIGVAAETVDNSGGSAGDKNINYYPTYPTVLFEATTATTTAAKTDEGESVDLAAAGTVNVGSYDYQQFMVDDYNYTSATVLGHFVDNAYGGKPS